MVYLGLSLSIHGVESELFLVNTVRESEEWEVCALNHANNFICTRIELASFVIGCNWHQMSQLLVGHEGSEGDTKVDLVVEGDVVEETFEVASKDLIIGVSVSWDKI